MNSTQPNKDVFYSNSTEPLTHDLPFAYGAVIFSATMLIPMAVFGLIANLITLIVIAKSETLKSIFNYILVSLCMSDLLSALFSPLPLYRQTWGFDEWKLHGALCKASFAVDAWTTYVTTLHILLFALFRLISVQWPISYKKVTVLQVRIIIVCIWAIGFGCGFLPYWVMFKDITRDRFSDGPDSTWSHCSLNPAWIVEFITYYKVTYPLFIYFPMAAIIVLCPVIGIIIKRRRLRKHTERLIRRNHKWGASYYTGNERLSQTRIFVGNSGRKRRAVGGITESEVQKRRKERNALLQLGFITGSFMLGYIPNTAHVVYTTNVVPTTMSMRILEWNLYMMGYIFLRLSECLNPLFYNLASNKMRQETFKFFRNCCCKTNCDWIKTPNSSPQTSGNGSSGMTGL